MVSRATYLLTLLLFISGAIYSQERKLQHRPYSDRRLWHAGFTIGLHTQDLILTQSGFVQENGEVWFSEIPRYSPGLTVGIIGDLYLNSWMNLRMVPTLYLGEKSILFKEQWSGEEYAASIRNNYISLPLQVKIAAARINNFRPYLIMGGYGSLELASPKNEAVRLKPYDLGITLGVGCDFYLPLFKVAPELKFRFGLIDLLESDRPDLKDEQLLKYASSLSGATQRMITLSLNFE